METYCDSLVQWLDHVWPWIAMIVVIAYMLLMYLLGGAWDDA